MSEFTLHTLESAPAASQPLLEKAHAAYGRVPNLLAVMADAPSLLEAYQRLHELFSESSFSPEELTVVWQSINVENGCHYCVPAHTAIAKAMDIDPAITEALRDESPLPNERLEALRTFSLAVRQAGGRVDTEAVEHFLAAGFSRTQVLELLVGYAQKILSNATNHLAQTPLDAAFKPFAWQRGGQ